MVAELTLDRVNLVKSPALKRIFLEQLQFKADEKIAKRDDNYAYSDYTVHQPNLFYAQTPIAVLFVIPHYTMLYAINPDRLSPGCTKSRLASPVCPRSCRLNAFMEQV